MLSNGFEKFSFFSKQLSVTYVYTVYLLFFTRSTLKTSLVSRLAPFRLFSIATVVAWIVYLELTKFNGNLPKIYYLQCLTVFITSRKSQCEKKKTVTFPALYVLRYWQYENFFLIQDYRGFIVYHTLLRFNANWIYSCVNNSAVALYKPLVEIKLKTLLSDIRLKKKNIFLPKLKRDNLIKGRTFQEKTRCYARFRLTTPLLAIRSRCLVVSSLCYSLAVDYGVTRKEILITITTGLSWPLRVWNTHVKDTPRRVYANILRQMVINYDTHRAPLYCKDNENN